MKIIEMLNKIEELEKQLEETRSQLDSFKKDIFGISEGDLMDIKAFIKHNIKMNKLLRQMED